MSNAVSSAVISTLPLGEEDCFAFIECANQAFERVIARIEPQNPGVTRRLWDADAYVRSTLKENMLPIDRDYALHLVDVFLVHHIIDLAVKADRMANH